MRFQGRNINLADTVTLRKTSSLPQNAIYCNYYICLYLISLYLVESYLLNTELFQFVYYKSSALQSWPKKQYPGSQIRCNESTWKACVSHLKLQSLVQIYTCSNVATQNNIHFKVHTTKRLLLWRGLNPSHLLNTNLSAFVSVVGKIWENSEEPAQQKKPNIPFSRYLPFPLSPLSLLWN